MRILNSKPSYDFWSDINTLGDPISVMVSPNKQQHFEEMLHLQNVTYFTKIQDVQQALSKVQNNSIAEKRLQRPLMSFDKYYSFDQVNNGI